MTTFGDHTQRMFGAFTWANRVWMCCQAATNWGGVMDWVPQEYQLPLNSWSKSIRTGQPNALAAAAKRLRYVSSLPAVICASGTVVDCQEISVYAP